MALKALKRAAENSVASAFFSVLSGSRFCPTEGEQELALRLLSFNAGNRLLQVFLL